MSKNRIWVLSLGKPSPMDDESYSDYAPSLQLGGAQEELKHQWTCRYKGVVQRRDKKRRLGAFDDTPFCHPLR